MNLVVAMTIFAVALKAYLNFGGGLAEHCKYQNKVILLVNAYIFNNYLPKVK